MFIPSVPVVGREIPLEASREKWVATATEATTEADERGLNDAALSARVRRALIEVLGSDGFRIGSEVSRGRVTLEFAPDLSPAQRAEAQKAVREVEGVAEVVSVDQA